MNDCIKPPYISQDRWNNWINVSSNRTNISKTTPLKCSICLLPIKKLTKWDKLHLGYSTVYQSLDIMELECKHIFHKKCIKIWLNKSETCPNCRFQVTNRE